MALLNSIYHRQLAGYSAKKFIPTDFSVMSFCCHRMDEHIVRGRDDTMDVPPFASRFSDSQLGGHLLACADEDGSVTLCDTRKRGPRSVIKEWTAHSNAIFDIAWMKGEPKLVTASGDQTAALWDVEKGKKLTEFRGHSCSLKSVNIKKDNTFVIGTGARDGNVMIWDTRCNRCNGYNKPTNIIRDAHAIQVKGTPQQTKKRSRRKSVAQNTQSQQSVTAVIFQDTNKLISADAMDGNIKVWDLRKTYTTLKCQAMPYHMFPYPGNEPRRHGFSSLVLDANDSKLYASCTNHRIYMYDCTVFKENPITSFTGHDNKTFYVKSALSPDDNYLISGSGDNNAYIWNVNMPQAPPMLLVGHVGEVTSVDWCPSDNGKLVTCSDDNNVRIWRMCRNDGRNKLDYCGWCENTVPKPKSPVNDASTSGSINTPSKNNVHPSTTASIILTPNSSVMRLSSPMHMARSPLLTTPGANKFLYNPPSQTVFPPSTPTPSNSTKTQRKQQLLSSWLKLTPSKENTPNDKTSGFKNGVDVKTSKQENNLNASTSKEDHNNNGEVITLKENSNSSDKSFWAKNKKSLFSHNITQAEENVDTKENNISKGKRSQEFVQNGDVCKDESSPARKRQCIGLLDSRDCTSSKCGGKDDIEVLNSEKENIGPCNDVNIESHQKENNQRTDNCINWFINWRVYIKNNKMNERCKKRTVSEELDNDEQTKANNEIQVDPRQSIRKYFKPVLSPIKEHKSQESH